MNMIKQCPLLFAACSHLQHELPLRVVWLGPPGDWFVGSLIFTLKKVSSMVHSNASSLCRSLMSDVLVDLPASTKTEKIQIKIDKGFQKFK